MDWQIKPGRKKKNQNSEVDFCYQLFLLTSDNFFYADSI